MMQGIGKLPSGVPVHAVCKAIKGLSRDAAVRVGSATEMKRAAERLDSLLGVVWMYYNY